MLQNRNTLIFNAKIIIELSDSVHSYPVMDDIINK